MFLLFFADMSTLISYSLYKETHILFKFFILVYGKLKLQCVKIHINYSYSETKYAIL